MMCRFYDFLNCYTTINNNATFEQKINKKRGDLDLLCVSVCFFFKGPRDARCK